MDCLITTLRGSVSDSGLPRVGEIRLFCVADSNANTFTNGFKIEVAPGATVDIESVSGDACIAQVSSESNTSLPSSFSSRISITNTYSGSTYYRVVFANADCEVRVLNKYAISHLRIFSGSESVVKNWGLKDFSQIKGSAIIDGYCYGVKVDGMLSYDNKDNTPLTAIRIGIQNSSTMQPGGIDVDNLPLNISALGLDWTSSSGSLENLFTEDRPTMSNFYATYTKISGDVSAIAKWMLGKGLYSKQFRTCSYMTAGRLQLTNETYSLVSNDNGVTYNLLRAGTTTMATYTIATDSWSYPSV